MALLRKDVYFFLSPLQRLLCWGALWAGAVTAAVSQTSVGPPVTPQASASPPACPTSPCTSSTPTAPANRSQPSQGCLQAQELWVTHKSQSDFVIKASENLHQFEV